MFTGRTNLVAGFIVMENTVLIISDQCSSCQLMNHLCVSIEGRKQLKWLYRCVRDM